MDPMDPNMGEIRHRSIGPSVPSVQWPPLLPPDLSFDIQVVPGHETSLGVIEILEGVVLASNLHPNV